MKQDLMFSNRRSHQHYVKEQSKCTPAIAMRHNSSRNDKFRQRFGPCNLRSLHERGPTRVAQIELFARHVWHVRVTNGRP